MSTHPWKVSNIAGVAEPCAIPGSGRDLLREPLFLAQVYSVSSVVVSAQSRSPEVSMQVQVGWEASLWPVLTNVSLAWRFCFGFSSSWARNFAFLIWS